MIDIRQTSSALNQTTSRPERSSTRLIFALLFGVLLVAAVVVAWIFLRSSRTIELAEKNSFPFKNYTVTLDSISRNICPDTGPAQCEDSKKEYSVQLRIQRSGDTAISYQYLTLPSRAKVEGMGLEVQLLSIDAGKKTAQVKLTRK